VDGAVWLIRVMETEADTSGRAVGREAERGSTVLRSRAGLEPTVLALAGMRGGSVGRLTRDGIACGVQRRQGRVGAETRNQGQDEGDR